MGDDAAWGALEDAHVPGCAWVVTRAHRVVPLLPPLTPEEYRTCDRADLCPRCQGTDYEVLDTDVVSATQILQGRHCFRCGLRWAAVFRIAGYVRAGHESEDFDALYSVACVDTETGR